MKPFKNTFSFIFILISSLLSFSMSAQNLENLGCETIMTSESIEYYKTIKPKLKTFEEHFIQHIYAKKHKSSQIKHKIPIKINVIRNSDGTGGIDTQDIEQAIQDLNVAYGGAYMNFYLWQTIDYIDNDLYVNFKKGDEINLTKTNYTPGLINIYFTNHIENASGTSICGYSKNDVKDGSHIIIMKNSCTTNGSSLTHEMGHVFSLLHTHGPNNTETTTELVDRSNCDTTGDGICDTPADPKLSSNTINNFCEYIGKAVDANGDTYSPDTKNIMSYSRKACRTHFSQQQLARMYAYFNFEKKQFIYSKEDEEITEAETNIYSFDSIKIHPNPVSDGNIYMTSSVTGKISYQVVNFQGQTLFNGSMASNGNGQINVSTLPSGSYVLILSNDLGARLIKKFIK
ncbi:zinc-dependent metalloprotease [Tamlana sp. 2201CG12-4]|uniref:zinc-dependent metalloprotease n=1 Tax=Tamlana sp. 2201CG12-4 TaxID=3112582 RepID=UPI002DBB1FB8|nr:zinc-dependent metalloprotease [Tamlana sp. 2201CG12-4]MEC3907391.1 zinc-dependent metalloprotease [Tamlana sp. 2201CG12-4]